MVRLHDSFKLGEHLCLVMEAMHMNLRTVLKTYGGTQGIAVKAVSVYGTEMTCCCCIGWWMGRGKKRRWMACLRFYQPVPLTELATSP